MVFVDLPWEATPPHFYSAPGTRPHGHAGFRDGRALSKPGQPFRANRSESDRCDRENIAVRPDRTSGKLAWPAYIETVVVAPISATGWPSTFLDAAHPGGAGGGHRPRWHRVQSRVARLGAAQIRGCAEWSRAHRDLQPLAQRGFGLLFIVAFGAGLVIVLTATGFAMVYSGRYLNRVMPASGLPQRRLTGAVPLLGAEVS